jgi:HSP20 family molecular chaperone IbpA
MKRALALIFSFTVIAALAAGQDKVTVPLSSPGQPATVKARLVSGSITVTAGTGPQVVIDSQSTRGDRDSRREDRNVPPGMHRIDAGGHGFNVEEDHNVVTVVPDFGGQNTNLTIQVPVNTSVELKTVNGGHIEVTGLSGNLDVENVNGSVTLKNVSGSVSASTVNGTLTVSLDRVTPDKPMSFSSLNGKVDVTLPADAKARLRIKTTNGAVYSDFDVKMEPDTSKPVVEDGRGQGGKYRIRTDRGVYGSINGGGPEYSFQTMNGSILIHKK